MGVKVEEITEVKRIIEGLLFAWGEPLSIADISSITKIDKKRLKIILKEMMEEFNHRGLRIIRINDSYQLTTREEHFEWIKKLITNHEKSRLSNAAIETLSIVAYKQPITRTQIEDIRGVKSNKVLDSLETRGLIEELGRLDQIGKPIIYGTTDEFLRFFSIASLDELPDLELDKQIEFENIKDIENQKE